MSAVGRGGEGDVGQRIRDEILVIQASSLHIINSLELPLGFTCLATR